MPEPSVNKSLIQSWWPILTTVALVFAAGVRADTQLAHTEKRVEYLYEEGSPAIVPRLARIEATQEQIVKQLDRVEKKIDNDRR